MLRSALLATCLAWSGAALATEVKLPGTAAIGPESRGDRDDVRMHPVAVAQRDGSLRIGFDIPNFEALEKRFDFGALRGTGGHRKPLTEITVVQSVRLSANGSIAFDGTSFSLGTLPPCAARRPS